MQYYKVHVYLPQSHLETLMVQINRQIKSIYPHYDYVFSYQEVQSLWRPLPGANPYAGKSNEIHRTSEIKLVFTIQEKDIEKIQKIILQNHPYETPVIEFYPVKI